MKKILMFAVAALSLASFAKTEKLLTVTVADIETLTRQAGLLGEQCGMPMLGMIAAQGLQSNPAAELLGPARAGEAVTISIYGDAEKFSIEDGAEAFEKSIGFDAVYPCTKTKAQFIADNAGCTETNDVVKFSYVLWDMYAAFSPDGKWLALADDPERAKSAVAGSATKNKAAFGAAFDVRVTEAGMGFANKALTAALPEIKSGLTPEEALQLDRVVSLCSQIKKVLVALRVADKGFDVLSTVTPVAGSELAKCGEKPFTKADPLSFAGKESFYAAATAADCGVPNDAECFENLLACLKSKGFNTDCIKVTRNGSETKTEIDIKKVVACALSDETKKAFENLGDPIEFLKQIKPAVTPKTDGTFKAASPECMTSLSFADTSLKTTASERFAKAFPDLVGKKPYCMFTCSAYALIKTAITQVLAAMPQSDETSQVSSMLVALPQLGDGSISCACWKEKGDFMGILRVTPDEMKNLFTLGSLFISCTTSSMTIPLDDDEWDDDDDE